MQQSATTSFVTTTQEDLKALAKRISTIDPLAAQRLAMLSEALANQPGSAIPSATSWATGDIHDIIDIDTITERARGQGSNRFISVLEWLRNGFIVLPLALTWFGISEAVSHYHTLLQSDANQATQPFIFLWEQGFGGSLSPIFTLSSLALIDFILLCIIIALTLIVSWRHGVIEHHNEQYAARLRSELADGLARASLCLAEKKLSQPGDFGSIVMRLDHIIQQISGRLDTVTQQMSTMVQQFLTELQEERKQRGSLDTFLQGLETISNNMLSGAASIQNATTTLTTSLDALVRPVQEIPAQQQVLIQKADDILAQFGPVTNDLHQLVTDQQGFNRAFYDMFSQSLGQFLTQQGQVSKDLVDAIDTFNASQNQVIQLIQQVQTTTAHQQQLLQVIENDHKSQIALTHHMRDTANGMKEALKAMQLTTPELRSATVDISKLTRALHDISQSADHMANAAGTVQQAGQALQTVAVMLQGSPNGQGPYYQP